MIYAMPGMQTQLHAVINQPGDYEGFSANYSGAGFSGMRFQFHGPRPRRLRRLGREGARATASRLGRDEYLELEQPSEAVPAMHFASVDPDLFRRVAQPLRRGGPRSASTR